MILNHPRTVPTRRLPNYLRRARRAIGLSQKEMAFLLGARTSGNVSRYERFARVPSLRTALLMEAMFAVPARELFAGLFAAAQERAAQRAQALLDAVSDKPSNKAHAMKVEALRAIAGLARHSNSIPTHE